MNNPPTTLPEALEVIEELRREVRYAERDSADAAASVDKLQDEMDDLRESSASPAELLAFGDKWARQRNGFTGNATGGVAGSLCFATIDHQGKRYTAHGIGILAAISNCEDNFRNGLACKTSIQLPVHA